MPVPSVSGLGNPGYGRLGSLRYPAAPERGIYPDLSRFNVVVFPWLSMETTVPVNQGWRNIAVHLQAKTDSPFSGMFLTDAVWY